MHHTEYLETLVAQGKLRADSAPATVAYHDPCYLGRHNGVYDAPRNLLKILSNDLVELDRNRENSFCCGAGGAQFWKEEEPGTQKISDNRYREAQQALAGGEDRVLAVGCPFCKSMLDSTAARGNADAIAVKDVAELLLESVEKKLGKVATAAPASLPEPQPSASSPVTAKTQAPVAIAPSPENPVEPARPVAERKKWEPKAAPSESKPAATPSIPAEPQPAKRKTWTPKPAAAKEAQPNPAEEKLPDA
jgi:Cysteine-rich domain